MHIFGKSNGGGRRRASRENLPMPALVSTIDKTYVAVLVDLSNTGARLSGFNLPRAGKPMTLRIECVRAFGIVAWSEEGQCGVEFDDPLPDFEVERLKRAPREATLTTHNLSERLAMDEWQSGSAR